MNGKYIIGEKDMTIKRKVYVDMDGVIADFFKALEIKYDGTIVGNANNMTVNNTALLDIINNQQRQIDLLLGYIQPMKSCNCSVGLLQCDNVSHVVDSYKILNQCGL